MEISITSVIVPDGRFRGADNVRKLADSLTAFGQIQPIVLEDETNVLIAGFRRLSAARMLGWSTIDCVYRSNLTDRQKRELELEENIQRLDMTPVEIAQAKSEIHRMRALDDPNWTQRATANQLETSVRDISESLLVAKVAELFPDIMKAKTMTQALSMAKHKLSLEIRKDDAKDSLPPDKESVARHIILGDCVDVIKQIPDETFTIVLTDPPFGIDYDTRTGRNVNVQQATSYKDDAENYERLLTMAPDLYRVLRPNGWLIWFLGPSWYERCKLVFRAAGFIVDEMPIVWDRSDGPCYTVRPDRYFGRAYDLAIHCAKGEPQIIKRNKPNVLRIPPVENSDRELLVERPIALYSELLDRLIVPGEAVLDPFTGSGSVLAAAALKRCPYLGIELDPQRRIVAINKVAANTPQ